MRGEGLSLARGKDIQNGASHTSAKQVAANRRNALRSTGPRTPEGKRASKLNAVKHGLRANEVVIPGQEDPAEFEEFVRGFYDDLRPLGSTESSYVNDLAIAEWRLRRARRVELGEIRTRQLDSNEQIKIDAFYETAYEVPGMLPKILPKSTRGIADLKRAVSEAIEELSTKGSVSRDTCARLNLLFGDLELNPARRLKGWFPDKTSKAPEKSLKESKGSASGPEAVDLDKKPVPGPPEVGATASSASGSEGVDAEDKRVPGIQEMGQTMSATSDPENVNLDKQPVPGPLGAGPTESSASGPEGVDPNKKREPEPEGVDPELKATALEHLNRCLEKLELARQIVAQQEELRHEIDCQRASMPKETDVERLRRYEIAIKRDRDRAIEKLEAFQNRRSSKPGSREWTSCRRGATDKCPRADVGRHGGAHRDRGRCQPLFRNI